MALTYLQLNMFKQERKQMQGKVYRQFSRQRYNKYKHQYPKMRQSQIVQKIIIQWQGLDLAAKEQLQRNYLHNNFMAKEEVEEHQSQKKPVQKQKQLPTHQKSQISVIQSTPKKQILVRNYNSQQKWMDVEDLKIEQPAIFSAIATPAPKQKLKTSVAKMQYLNFYQHYYEDMKKNHPKWTNKQITNVIKIIWKKKKDLKKNIEQNTKKLNKQKIIKKSRSISASILFKKQTGGLWKSLPLQTKKMWQKKSLQLNREAKRQQLRRTPNKQNFVIRLGSETPNKNLNFLKQNIE